MTKEYQLDSMAAEECDRLIHNKTWQYLPMRSTIKAIQYDGTAEMAIAIDARCPNSYIEWEEEGWFWNLRAFTEWGLDNSKSQDVEVGDYLVRVENRYVLYPREDFEKAYYRGYCLA